jgi:ABC-type transport system involved in Fe-S cluster assembly fused permease/ATPase subunit
MINFETVKIFANEEYEIGRFTEAVRRCVPSAY